MDTHSKKIHEQNKNCYRHELLTFDEGLFDSCINMAYVFTMENSGRIPHFTKQLEQHKPSSKVTVQYNKGFRNCTKNIKEQSTPYDITDSLRNIFVDAVNNDYDRILVFEDDFIMDKDAYKQKDIDSICKYIKKHGPDVYTLGTLIHLSIPFTKHPHIFYTGHAHAVLYNRKYMTKFIEAASQYKIKHCDQYWHRIKFKMAGYHKPICYQLFSDTENMSEWGMLWKFNSKWLKLWKLDTSYEHYQAHTKFFTALHWIVLIIIIVLILLFIRFLIKSQKRRLVVN